LIRQALSALADYDDVIIFHLSAQAQVIESWNRPYETVQTNTVGR
jgi:dTDP-glucose 4,6-dehydratase